MRGTRVMNRGALAGIKERVKNNKEEKEWKNQEREGKELEKGKNH